MAERRTGGELDWAEAYQRLARLADTAAVSKALTPEEALARLDARARLLARPPQPEISASARLEVAHFRSSGQSYALHTRYVHEVLRAPELTPLPGAPALLRGLLLLRGEVLPVVELATLFGRPAQAATGLVLVVGLERPELGLCAEEVEEVTHMPRDAFLPPPAALDAEMGGLVSGVHRAGTLLLEADALLGDSRLFFDISDEGSS